ncbi:hypothetical protein [Acetobacterium fimetarium]|nr:hypothetical protein [Acetobacterium fimetarium]
METILVILGGALGSTTRFYLGRKFASCHDRLPIGSFFYWQIFTCL